MTLDELLARLETGEPLEVPEELRGLLAASAAGERWSREASSEELRAWAERAADFVANCPLGDES